MSDKPRFLIGTHVRDAGTFEEFARIAAQLKRFGQVALQVGQQASKTAQDIPPGGSPWHEYTAWMPVISRKFYPHPILQPFIDMAHVEANVAMLRERVVVLRKHGLSALFHDHNPFFLPEGFFQEYPRIRGARVDHPRRTTEEAFAPCRDVPEGQELQTWALGQLQKDVPELTDIGWFTNDAGAGICWTDYLYPGPNGPDRCRNLGSAVHVANVLRPYIDAGLDVTAMHANIFGAELRSAQQAVADKPVYWGSSGDPRVINISAGLDNPLVGVFDPVAILQAMERMAGGNVQKVAITLGTQYTRGHELTHVAQKVVEIIAGYLESPATGTLGRLQLLRSLCERWAGHAQADALLEGLVAAHEALAYRQATVPRFTGHYVGVSMRHITRPLVAMPEKLSEEEENYFLPHVFNPDLDEARMDYLDWHGGKLTAGNIAEAGADPRLPQASTAAARLSAAGAQLESLGGEGDAAAFRDLGLSLRMYASIVRSIGNFYAMQMVRDRNADRFANGPQVHSKVGTATGDPDNLLMQDYMRDELDNTAALIEMLESGGIDLLVTARSAGDTEDTFMLGGDVADQLRRKMTIMRRHWRDSEPYLATPHK